MYKHAQMVGSLPWQFCLLQGLFWTLHHYNCMVNKQLCGSFNGSFHLKRGQCMYVCHNHIRVSIFPKVTMERLMATIGLFYWDKWSFSAFSV